MYYFKTLMEDQITEKEEPYSHNKKHINKQVSSS